MRRVVIVGNGFIHHLGALTQVQKANYEGMGNFVGRNGGRRCERIITELEKVSTLFNHFDQLQSELAHFFSSEVKYEELFERLDALLEWYIDKNKFKNIIDEKCFKGLEILVEKIIAEKLVPIVRGFEEQELNGTYADLFRLIPGETIGDRVVNEQQKSNDKIGVFTTNYDGFLIQLLRTYQADYERVYFFGWVWRW